MLKLVCVNYFKFFFVVVLFLEVFVVVLFTQTNRKKARYKLILT